VGCPHWRPEPGIDQLDEALPCWIFSIELEAVEPELRGVQQVEGGIGHPFVVRCAVDPEVVLTTVQPWERITRAIELREVEFVIGGEKIAVFDLRIKHVVAKSWWWCDGVIAHGIMVGWHGVAGQGGERWCAGADAICVVFEVEQGQVQGLLLLSLRG
jgi:hypothetical protein